MLRSSKRIKWACRACFGIVFFWNVLCALQFLCVPDQFIAAYQLSGEEGKVALRGLGVTFLMWNATYPAFIYAPQRYHVLGWVILVQQCIGLIGEGAILLALPADGFAMLSSSIARFVAFDLAGLVIMGVSFALLQKLARNGIK